MFEWIECCSPNSENVPKIPTTTTTTNEMHFIDFLLHLICIICSALKTFYIFSFDYLIPVVGHILPILTKCLSQLMSLLVRIFFTYIAPCIIQVVTGTTYVFTKILNAMSVAAMTIIDSDVNLEYAHAIIMLSVVGIVVYFHITERIFRFFHEWYQILLLYLRFVLNILKLVQFCFKFVYKKITGTSSTSQLESHSNEMTAIPRKKDRFLFE